MALTNGTDHAITNGATAIASDDHVASFWTRYEHLKLQGVMNNLLIEVDAMSPSRRLTARMR